MGARPGSKRGPKENRGVREEEQAPSSPSARRGRTPRRDPRRCLRTTSGTRALSAPIQTDNTRLASS